MRAAEPADATPEPPMLYSKVGRRSSPGLPAVAVAVESVRVAAPPAERRSSVAAPPRDPDDHDRLEIDADELLPPADRHSATRTRPPAPEAFSPDLSDGESIARTLDRLIASDSLSSPSMFPKEESLTGPRELFGTLAVGHVRPVRELLIDLRWGEPSSESFAAAAAAVLSLRGAADSLSLGELAEALTAFGDAIAEPRDASTRLRASAAYDELVRLLPAAFAFEAEHAQRESVTVQSLVLQVEGADRSTLERIAAAGVATVGALAAAPASELTQVAGIPPEVAARIVDAARAYRDDERPAKATGAHGPERDRLRVLCQQLADLNEAFEQASLSWTAEAMARKRKVRQDRDQSVLAINALLARLGEIRLLEQLDRLPFEQKLDRLRTFLSPQTPASAPR